MSQVAGVCRSLAWSVDLKPLLVDWERVKVVHFNTTLLLVILQSQTNNSSFPVMLVLVK